MITANFAVATSEDWIAQVTLSDAADLTSAVALMQVKPDAGFPDSWIDLSSGGGNDPGLTFTLNTTTKLLSWTIPQDRVWEIPPGIYALDVLVIYGSGQRKREMTGTLTVTRGVTDASRADPSNMLDVGGAILGTES